MENYGTHPIKCFYVVSRVKEQQEVFLLIFLVRDWDKGQLMRMSFIVCALVLLSYLTE